jgi:hypothetical protein
MAQTADQLSSSDFKGSFERARFTAVPHATAKNLGFTVAEKLDCGSVLKGRGF